MHAHQLGIHLGWVVEHAEDGGLDHFVLESVVEPPKRGAHERNVSQGEVDDAANPAQGQVWEIGDDPAKRLHPSQELKLVVGMVIILHRADRLGARARGGKCPADIVYPSDGDDAFDMGLALGGELRKRDHAAIRIEAGSSLVAFQSPSREAVPDHEGSLSCFSADRVDQGGNVGDGIIIDGPMAWPVGGLASEPRGTGATQVSNPDIHSLRMKEPGEAILAEDGVPAAIVLRKPMDQEDGLCPRAGVMLEGQADLVPGERVLSDRLQGQADLRRGFLRPIRASSIQAKEAYTSNR